MRMKPIRILVFLVPLAWLSLWLIGVVQDYFNPHSPANASMQLHLKMFGSAIYEYHSQIGRWPTKVDDLAQTSLPARSPLWRQSAAPIVFLWPQNLKPEPKDNPNVLLAYWKGGWFNKFGRVWVCWGDLRTEHAKESDLRAAEKNQH